MHWLVLAKKEVALSRASGGGHQPVLRLMKIAPTCAWDYLAPTCAGHNKCVCVKIPLGCAGLAPTCAKNKNCTNLCRGGNQPVLRTKRARKLLRGRKEQTCASGCTNCALGCTNLCAGELHQLVHWGRTNLCVEVAPTCAKGAHQLERWYCTNLCEKKKTPKYTY